MKRALVAIIAIGYLFGTIAFAQDLTSSHFIVRDPSIGSGGGYQSSGSFKMYSAGNLNVSGNAGSSANYQARDGFLQFPEANSGIVATVATGSTINVTWNASSVADGYTISGYNLGIATNSGGPYTFTSVGNVTSYSYTNQVAGTYYFVLQTLDAFGNVIATSNEANATVQETISFGLSANAISFGSLLVSNARYATTGGGSNTVAVAHTITAASNASTGYVLGYSGSTLDSNGNDIAPVAITGSASGTPGTSQFALSLAGVSGVSVPAAYDQSSSNWNFVPSALQTIATTAGPAAPATLSAYYIANVPTSAAAGNYTTTLTYELTANY